MTKQERKIINIIINQLAANKKRNSKDKLISYFASGFLRKEDFSDSLSFHGSVNETFSFFEHASFDQIKSFLDDFNILLFNNTTKIIKDRAEKRLKELELDNYRNLVTFEKINLILEKGVENIKTSFKNDKNLLIKKIIDNNLSFRT